MTLTQTPSSDEPTQALLQFCKHEIKVHFGPYTLDPKAYNHRKEKTFGERGNLLSSL